MANTNINTAVEFLSEVSKKDFNERELKRYLFEKQGLTFEQVNEAFRIHRSLSNNSTKEMLPAKTNLNANHPESKSER